MSFARGATRDNQRTTYRSNEKSRMSTIKPAGSKGVAGKTTGVNEGPVIAPQQSSIMEIPQLAAKPSKLKAVPVRQTLTSKLRMEKANPLLTSTASRINESLQVVETPVRRLTFHPGMIQAKQKLEFKFPLTESRLSMKKTISNGGKKSIGTSLSKENKPPPNTTHLKTKISNKKNVITTQSQTGKNYFSLQKRNTSNIQNKKGSVENQNIHTNGRNKYIPTSMSKDSVANATSKPKLLNSTKTGVAESRKSIMKNTTVGTCVQNSVSKKCVKLPAKKQLKSILRKSASVGDLQKLAFESEESNVLGGTENVLYLGTKSMSQKSVAFCSPLQNTTFSPVKGVNTPPPSVLRKRLEDWLAKRGKSSLNYHHLYRFGRPQSSVTQPKVHKNREEPCLKEITSDINETGEPCLNETITYEDGNREEPGLNETITVESSNSTFTLSSSHEKDEEIDFEDSAPQGSSTPEGQSAVAEPFDDKENAASLVHPEALRDLRKLVRLGYPRDQCEQWLSFISKSHPSVKEFPQYWECVAALEEARGEFGSAVSCYERAVVKGADAQEVDDHLDELWEKLNALSVSAAQSTKSSKNSVVDPKHLFKSTIIKFALQQKAVRKFSKEKGVSLQSVSYIVTPVRRSTRKSVSRFKTPPTMTCVDTLDNLDPSIRDVMEFKGNNVLYPEN